MERKPDPATHPALTAERKRMLESRVLADRHSGAYGKAYSGPTPVMERPPYVPAKFEYARSGAGDAAKIKSKGF